MREEVLYNVFLELQKYYDALEIERCTEILIGYGVGPHTKRILRHYWGSNSSWWTGQGPTMAPHSEAYEGSPRDTNSPSPYLTW